MPRWLLFSCFLAALLVVFNPVPASAQMPNRLEVPLSDWPERVQGSVCGNYRCLEIKFKRTGVFLFVPEREMTTFRQHIKAANVIFERQGSTSGANPRPVYVWLKGAVLADHRRTGSGASVNANRQALPNTLDKAAAARLAMKLPAFDTFFFEIGRGERVAGVPRSIRAAGVQWGFVVPECFRKPILEGGYKATLCIAYLPDRKFPRGNIPMRCQWATSSNLHHPGYVCAAKSQLTEPAIRLIYERLIIEWR